MNSQKEKSEINGKKENTSFKRPLVYAAMVFIIVVVSEKIGFSKYSIPSIDPVSWAQFFQRGFPKAFLISLSVFLAMYFWQFLRKKH